MTWGLKQWHKVGKSPLFMGCLLDDASSHSILSASGKWWAGRVHSLDVALREGADKLCGADKGFTGRWRLVGASSKVFSKQGAACNSNSAHSLLVWQQDYRGRSMEIVHVLVSSVVRAVFPEEHCVFLMLCVTSVETPLLSRPMLCSRS